MLENGILLSCAYDKIVKVWSYKNHEELESFTKPDELRCMDYLPDGGTLLIGTNSGSILSEKIEKFLNYDDMEDLMIEMGDMESEDHNHDQFDQYDPLEGLTVDEQLQKILKEKKGLTKGKATFK